MPIYHCDVQLDGTRREYTPHGTPSFPVACYEDDFHRDVVPWPWHDEFEALVVTEGHVAIGHGAGRQVLGPGEGFFFNSGELHRLWAADDGASKLHAVVFHPRLVGGADGSVFWEKYVQPVLDAPSLRCVHLNPRGAAGAEVLECIQSAWRQCACELDGCEIQARRDLSWLLHALPRCQNDALPAPTERELRNGVRIKRMLQFIQDHFGEDIRLAEIARSAAISESECLRCFRATIGTTPMRYLRRYRIQRAAELLRRDGARISEVAALCGFQEMSYFARAFREEMGRVPSEFRAHDGEARR